MSTIPKPKKVRDHPSEMMVKNLEKRGWILYEQGGRDPRKFYEDLAAIELLVGSKQYQYKFLDGRWFVARAGD